MPVNRRSGIRGGHDIHVPAERPGVLFDRSAGGIGGSGPAPPSRPRSPPIPPYPPRGRPACAENRRHASRRPGRRSDPSSRCQASEHRRYSLRSRWQRPSTVVSTQDNRLWIRQLAGAVLLRLLAATRGTRPTIESLPDPSRPPKEHRAAGASQSTPLKRFVELRSMFGGSHVSLPNQQAGCQKVTVEQLSVRQLVLGSRWIVFRCPAPNEVIFLRAPFPQNATMPGDLDHDPVCTSCKLHIRTVTMVGSCT